MQFIASAPAEKAMIRTRTFAYQVTNMGRRVGVLIGGLRAQSSVVTQSWSFAFDFDNAQVFAPGTVGACGMTGIKNRANSKIVIDPHHLKVGIMAHDRNKY